MDKKDIIVQGLLLAFVIGGSMLCAHLFPLVSEEDQANYDTLESPEEITIVSGTDTLSSQRTTLQNVTYYKHFDYTDHHGGFDIKYINETGETLEMNIRHDYSIDIENGHLIIYV